MHRTSPKPKIVALSVFAACMALLVPGSASAQKPGAKAQKKAKVEVRKGHTGKKLFKNGKAISHPYRTLRPIGETGAHLGSKFGRVRTRSINSPLGRLRNVKRIDFNSLSVVGEKGTGRFSRVRHDKAADVILGERSVRKSGRKKRRGWTVVNPVTGKPYGRRNDGTYPQIFYRQIRSTKSGHLVGRNKIGDGSTARTGEMLLNRQGRPITKTSYKRIEEARLEEGVNGEARNALLGIRRDGTAVELSPEGKVLREIH